MKTKPERNTLLYGWAAAPRTVLGSPCIDALQPLLDAPLKGGLACPPEFRDVYAELARCLQRHGDMLSLVRAPHPAIR